MGKILRILRVTAIGLMVALVVLVVAELVASVLLGPVPEDDVPTAEFSRHEPAPYVMHRTTRDADVMVSSDQQREPGMRTHVVTDRRGFRFDGDLDRPKEPNEIRIFMLGGSAVFRGLEAETTICGFLESTLAKRLGPSVLVRCVNAGIVSAVSDQELAVLVHEVADLEPDLVIVFDGFNEIWCRSRLEPRLGHPFNWSLVEHTLSREAKRRDLMLASVAAMPSWQLLLSRSRLATYLRPGLALENQVTAEVAEAQAETYPRPHPLDVAKHLLRNWQKMNLITKALGGEFVAILQPMSPSARHHPVFHEFYSGMSFLIDRAAQDGKPFFSFDRLLDDRRELFYDEVHTWDEGHAIYADRIADLLLERGLIRNPSP
jgi:hypothetical protein